MAQAVDEGVGQLVQYAADGGTTPNPTAPIGGSAGLGIRGDNADFSVANWSVRAVP
jgi:hypothetical protein